MFMALFVVYGFDTAGTFGEETLDAGRQAPRGVLSAIWLAEIVGVVFLLGIILSFKDMGAGIASGQNFGLPIADTLIEQTWVTRGARSTSGSSWRRCTCARSRSRVRRPRLMFSMGRDRRLPLGSLWGHVSPSFKTPGECRRPAVGVPVGDPVPSDRQLFR